MEGLTAGTYWIVALDKTPARFLEPEVLTTLVGRGTLVTLGESETMPVRLTLTAYSTNR